MVEIRPEIAVNALIKQGVMLKVDGNILFTTPKSHCIILLNKNPHSDDYFVFVSASSQYVKRLEEANKRGLPASTVVMIRPNSYHHLPKYTAIDCNYIHAITRGELVTLYSEGRIAFYRNNSVINQSHLKQLIKGVVDSPLVIEEIKTLVQ